MNTKAIQLLTRVPNYSAKAIIVVSMVVLASLCTGYIISIASYFWNLSSNNGAHAMKLSDEVVKQIGTIRDGRLSEISGIADSLSYQDTFWVHNDSGNPAELFLIESDGTVLVRVQLKGASNRDWEDICTYKVDGKTFLCVGDVGDNRGNYKDYHLYCLEEPALDIVKLKRQKMPAKDLIVTDYSKVQFRYEDGPKNCEAFAFDQASSSFLFAEKGFDHKLTSKPGIYQLLVNPDVATVDKPVAIAKRIADCQLKHPTAMSISGDGSRLIISSYALAAVWRESKNTDWAKALASGKPALLPLPIQRQGEAITLNGDGSQATVTSEYANQPLWRVQVDFALQAVSVKVDGE